MFDADLNPLKDRSRAVLRHFGLGAYEEILRAQQRVHAARLADLIPDTWLLGEHPTVITQGVRGSESDLKSANTILGGAPVVKIDRGGMTTLHSPGQLILYPIVKLLTGSLGAGQFSRALVHGMQEWIAEEFKVESEHREGHPGLFVKGRKLLSVGISAREGVTMHGIALNISNDLKLWGGIVPCGAPDIQPVSLEELLSRKIGIAEQIPSLARWLKSQWRYKSVELAVGLNV